jgi:hypothetical protein
LVVKIDKIGRVSSAAKVLLVSNGADAVPGVGDYGERVLKERMK